MNNRSKRLIYSLLLLFAIAGVLALIMIKGPLAPVSVQTVRLTQGNLQPALFGVGTVEARRSYTIGPTRTGRVLQLDVDHGDRVITGQLLGKMDPVDLPDRLQSAQKSIERSEHQVEAAQSRLDEANSRSALARREAKRYRELLAKSQISHEAAETKETDAKTAADQVRGAQADLEGARHDLQRLQSDLKALQAQIEELKLVSPVEGLVTAREVEPGSVIVAGTTVLRLIEPATLWVRTRIEQRGSGDIRKGQSAEILLRSQPKQPLNGSVARVELIADSLTEERWVDVAFDEIPEGVAVGTLANVTINAPEVPNAYWLPAAALQTHERQTGVWLIVSGKSHFAPVRTGSRTLDGKIQIHTGVTPEDLVVSYSPKPLSEDKRLKTTDHD
ncbi:RND family efflux transporter MFP subunit [Thiogranum longum]|uniref:RND family efflux transporter MFP subunit n=1 Tax=Thiogranum longum TaxID=1537524 RepID=A0A4R1HF51_9GAMM|nr:efflux RND transporter periplasmic adaptor subunit [Thiogranum longum]TCK17989.1 RND family efflux transporter MFP subunit [Thiogranum longum]